MTGDSMKRILFLVALIAIAPGVATGKRAPSLTPAQSAAIVDVVLVGTVVEIEKEMIEAESGPGAKDKMSYTVANVKVGDPIRGLKSETNLKIGFTPSARTGLNLTEKQEYLLFLTKHHSGNFYTLNFMSPPLAITADTKASVADVKAIGKILADPAKAMKAEKAEDKALAAVVLITKYRTYPNSPIEHTTEALPLDESQAILKSLGELDWAANANIGGFDTMRAFYLLAVGADSGWKQPAIKPGDDTVAIMHKAFVAWLKGPGAKFQIQKYIPKK